MPFIDTKQEFIGYWQLTEIGTHIHWPSFNIADILNG